MFDTFNFVDFTGDETEKEFLEKCLEQWDRSLNSNKTDTNRMLEIASVFHEMRHRVDELDEV